MARKGENIYKRKDGRWEGRYIKGRKPDGKAVYGSVYAPTYQEAKNRLQKEAAKQEYQAAVYAKDTFGKIAEQWLQSVRYQVKESSYVKYKSLIEKHIYPKLGGMELRKVTTEVLEGYINEQLECGRIKDGKGLSPKTVRDILSIIRQICSWAETQNYAIRCQAGYLKVKMKASEVHVLSVSNRKKLEQFLMDGNSRIGDGILLSLYTGMRIGEVCALRWEHILLDEGILQVRYTLQRIPNIEYKSNKSGMAKTKIIVTSPKSSCSNRDIPLPLFLLERIKKIPPVSRNAFFLTGSCDSYVEPRSMNNYFKRILRQCGIPETNYHTLRHTFATRCIELNFDAKTLSEILGHSNVNITLNRYVHISLEQKRRNMELLNF